MCKTVRRFGVELEGYVDSDVYGDHMVQGEDWYVDSDGSLNDSDGGCGRCDGDGEIECPDCEGSGNESCENCCGNGEVDCSDCDGSGYVEDDDGNEIECSNCDGSGDVQCNDCDGAGDIACSSCDSNRNITCPSCDGESSSDSRYGIEAKSPPLSDTNPIYSMYDWLKRNGWYVDRTAGLHIHVEARDYKDEDFHKLLALMAGVEPFVYTITDSWRYHNSYCQPINRCRSDALSLLMSGRGRYGGRRIFADTRYMGLNFESYDNHKTIEFRYFAPQDNAETVEKYVELMTKVVEFAKVASMEQILVIVEKLIQSQKSFDQLSEIVQQVFELSYEPIASNTVHIDYNWFTESDIQDIRQSQSNNIFVRADVLEAI